MERATAIASVGYTELSKNSGRSVLDLVTEACLGAIEDAGLGLTEVDGVASFMVLGDSVSSEAVATALALPPTRYVMDFQQGGQSPCWVVGNAAMAVSLGYAETVVVCRALNGRSGIRVGSSAFSGGAGQYRYPIGYDTYMQYIAMWARRYLIETGRQPDELGAIPIAQRWYAERNERAIQRKPLDLDGYLQSPRVVDPFRVADCTSEVDGACAVVVTSLERARDLRHRPAQIASVAYRAGARPGLDIGDHLLYEDYTRNFTSLLRDELFGRAGIGAQDIGFAEIYDCFSSTVVFGLEGLGFCERGEAIDFVASGSTAIDGRLPVNTNGGLLAEGYLHGMNTVAEAVLQVQGRCGERQVPRAEVGVVTSGALVDGSAMVLVAA
jgi:acetyl-CoA acetyltransferase